MITDIPIYKQKRSKLKITLEEVVNVFVEAIETDGADAAKEFFEQMNKYFSVLEGWSDAAKTIRAILAKARKLEKEERMDEEIAKLRAGAPNLLLMNQNEAYGMKDSRTISKRDITMTGNHATYEENNNPKE